MSREIGPARSDTRLQPGAPRLRSMNTNLAPRVASSGVSPLGALFIVLWSSAFIAGKAGLAYAGPFTLLFIRFGVAAAVLLGITLASGAPWPKRPIEYLHLAVVGLLMQGLTLGSAYFGLRLGVSAGVAALITCLAPVLTALLAGRVLGERIAPRQWLGILAGLVGVGLVVIDKVSFGTTSPLGYAAMFVALGAFVAGTLYQKKFCASMDLRSGNLVQIVAAAGAVALPALWLEGLHVQWSPELIVSSSWLSLVNSIGAMSLLYLLLRRGEASRVSLLFYLVPPVTALMGFAAFHETLGAVEMAGFAITVGGVYLGGRG